VSGLESFVDGQTVVVAEIAQAHDGSLGLAHAFIDAAARSNAGAIKFQTHFAEAESTPSEPWRVRFSTQDVTRFDYWKRMEFSAAQWAELRAHASDAGLLFGSSPFSQQALDVLDEIDVDFIKVASGEITNLPMLKAVAETGRPVVLSSGMSPWNEIDAAVETLQLGGPLAVLQCTSEYPCPPEKVGLNVIGELKDRYGLPVGLSDHSGTIFPGLAAAVLSISVLEVHLTLSPLMFGPDVPASVTPEELAMLVEGIRFLEQAMANPIDKNRQAEDLSHLRSLFMKSPVTVRPLQAGHRLSAGDIALKKPGGGLPPASIPQLVGRTLAHAVPSDHQLSMSDFVEV
jgi:N,N'-diacetyllegionaminate synthase